MLLYGNGRPINTNPNKDYRRLVTHCDSIENNDKSIGLHMRACVMSEACVNDV